MKRELAAECLGTFLLVFCGTGAIVANEEFGSVTHVGVSLTFGFTVLALIYSIGDVSGCHLNPAVTIGFCVAKRFEPRKLIPYCLSQLIGAIMASLMVRSVFPANELIGVTLPSGTAQQSFIVEAILTFFLMFVILSVSTGSKEKGILAGVAVGSVVASEAMFAGPICGASMNPARSLAPAIVSGRLDPVWIYVTAPIIGAIASVFICRCVHDSKCCNPDLQGKSN